jgi:hypothetical protein
MATAYNPAYKTSDGKLDYSKYISGLEKKINQLNADKAAAFNNGGGYTLIGDIQSEQNKIAEYVNNPTSEAGLAFEKRFFQQTAQSYGYLATYSRPEADGYKNTLIEQVKFFRNVRNTSLIDIQKEANTYVNMGVEGAKKDAEQAKKDAEGNWFDKLLNVALAVGIGVATGGIGSALAAEIGVSAAVGEAIVSASLGIIQGKSPEDIVKGIVGSVAANEVSGALKSVNAEIVKAGPNVVAPEVASALVNAERQVVSAAITGQDIGKAALAGAAGGAVASATSLASDSAAIQRAAGEYAQALVAGKTQEQALTSALSGFLNQQEKDAAKQKVLDEAAKNPDIAKLGGDQVSALPPVTVTATADPSSVATDLSLTNTTTTPKTKTPKVVTPKIDTPTLPTVTVTANADSSNVANNLSTTSTTRTTDSQTASKPTQTNNPLLLSLLNRPLTKTTPTGTRSSPTQTNASPGTQALAQALRVGDAGAPVFGGDKDKSKRSGWNTESLRYMGNSGDSNG